jgi:3-methylfumaryl-CoA hydratase
MGYADLSAGKEEWTGRVESRIDQVTAAPIAALSATLDRRDPFPRPGDPVPPLWHWLWFLPLYRQSELGPDGHSNHSDFLPPAPLPQRMWAGSRFEFRGTLRVGDTIARRSQVVDVQQKQGRTGPLVFVLARHDISNAGGIAITEEQDIVYRANPFTGDAAPAPEPRQAPSNSAWERTVVPDDVLLFRYSALTFNGHRIHYDRRYATEVAGYPGLVVHGPLIATLLIDLLRCNLPQASLSRFEFRAVSPLFDTSPFTICGKPEPGTKTVELWAKDSSGMLAMTATATRE